VEKRPVLSLEKEKLKQQWIASELATRERLYRDGDKFQLFDTLVFCAVNRLLLPPWAREALVRTYNAKEWGGLAAWSEVFGDVLPRRAQRAQQRRAIINESMGRDIVDEAANAREAGLPPNWDAIAKKVAADYSERRGEPLKLAGKTAEEIYHRTVAKMQKIYGESTIDDLTGNPKRGRPRKSR